MHHYTKPYCSACKQLPCPIHSPFTIRGGILESCSGDSLHWFCTPAAVTSRFNSGGLVWTERGRGRSFGFVQRSLRLAQRWPACTVQRSTFHWWIDCSWQAVNTRGEGIASGWVTFLFDFYQPWNAFTEPDTECGKTLLPPPSNNLARQLDFWDFKAALSCFLPKIKIIV